MMQEQSLSKNDLPRVPKLLDGEPSEECQPIVETINALIGDLHIERFNPV